MYEDNVCVCVCVGVYRSLRKIPSGNTEIICLNLEACLWRGKFRDWLEDRVCPAPWGAG